jgi:sRNA-binding carbon storage regulator CsrA
MLELDYVEGRVITIVSEIEVHLFQNNEGIRMIGIKAPKSVHVGRRKSLCYKQSTFNRSQERNGNIK